MYLYAYGYNYVRYFVARAMNYVMP